MATTGTVLINDILARVRDAAAQLNATDSPPTATTGRAFVLMLVNHSQLFVNLAERQVVATSNLNLTSGTACYDLNATIADYGGKVVGVNISALGEVDGPVDFKALGRGSRTWLKDTTVNAPISWAPIGRTILAFYPSATGTLIVRYLQAPTFLATEGANITLSDTVSEHIAMLGELLSRLKTRQLTGFDLLLKTFAEEVDMMDALQNAGGKAD
jgi:hypothetical protein